MADLLYSVTFTAIELSRTGSASITLGSEEGRYAGGVGEGQTWSHDMMPPVSSHAAGLQGADGVHPGHHMVADAAPALCKVRGWCNG